MSNYYDSPQYGSVMPAIDASVSERTSFIRKTYLHVFGAVLALVGLEAALLNTPLADQVTRLALSGKFAWMAVIGLYMVASMIANRWAASATSKATQYAGLGLYVAAISIVFLPAINIAYRFGGENVLPASVLITLTLFGGLTAINFFTKADFSFMGKFLMLAGFAALGLILCSLMFGFSLGIWFIFAMVVLMCGYILYDTSNIIHHYPTTAYVAASLALFASLATLFYYILQLVMALSSRD